MLARLYTGAALAIALGHPRRSLCSEATLGPQSAGHVRFASRADKIAGAPVGSLWGRQPARRVLPAPRERPRRRAAEQRDEVAPSHSITSSARRQARVAR